MKDYKNTEVFLDDYSEKADLFREIKEIGISVLISVLVTWLMRKGRK